jgi:hypothetical protein
MGDEPAKMATAKMAATTKAATVATKPATSSIVSKGARGGNHRQNPG